MTDCKTSSQHAAALRHQTGEGPSTHDIGNAHVASVLFNEGAAAPCGPLHLGIALSNSFDGVNARLRKIVDRIKHEAHDKLVQAIMVTAMVNAVIIALLVADLRSGPL